MDNGLSPEQQALFASIMGNSSQAKALNPVVEAKEPEKADKENMKCAADTGGDPNRMLSQAEIDALIASMTG